MGWNKHREYNIRYACSLSVLRWRAIARSGIACIRRSESLRIFATIKAAATKTKTAHTAYL